MPFFGIILVPMFFFVFMLAEAFDAIVGVSLWSYRFIVVWNQNFFVVCGLFFSWWHFSWGIDWPQWAQGVLFSKRSESDWSDCSSSSSSPEANCPSDSSSVCARSLASFFFPFWLTIATPLCLEQLHAEVWWRTRVIDFTSPHKSLPKLCNEACPKLCAICLFSCIVHARGHNLENLHFLASCFQVRFKFNQPVWHRCAMEKGAVWQSGVFLKSIHRTHPRFITPGESINVSGQGICHKLSQKIPAKNTRKSPEWVKIFGRCNSLRVEVSLLLASPS